MQGGYLVAVHEIPVKTVDVDFGELGKPVIHIGWSAPCEFVHDQGLLKSSLSPAYGMEEFVPYYDMGMNWGEPQLDDAIAKLWNLHTNYARWFKTGREHRNVINNRYSMDRRIEQVRKALGQIPITPIRPASGAIGAVSRIVAFVEFGPVVVGRLFKRLLVDQRLVVGWEIVRRKLVRRQSIGW